MNSLGMRIAVGVVALVCLTTAAQADLILVIDDLGTAGIDVVAIDGAGSGVGSSGGFWTSTVADASGTTGVVMFNGSVGSFSVNVTTGLSKPVIGPRRIDLGSVTVSGSAGTLRITLVDTDFVHPVGGMHSLVTEIGGTTDGTVSGIVGGVSTSNSESSFLPINSLGPFGPGAFSGSTWGVVTLVGGSPFSIGQVVDITHTRDDQNGQITSFDLGTQIPEPASMSLLLLGLAGIFVSRRRRR